MSFTEVKPEEIREIGGWPVRRYLGSGGFSWVFEVYDEGLKVSRALKLMKPEAAQGEGYKRFWREAQILASIDDPHLVRIYELDHDPERKLPYYVMELLSGSDLAKLLKTSAAEERPIEASRGVEIFLGVLQGLARLHELRPIIVHRDIKPANIWIADNGRAKLLDLGIAHVTRAGGDETLGQSVLTVEAGFIGTIRYASPEQLHCSELGPSSDVFSLGLCLFETLEGYHPYKGISDLSSQAYPVVLSYYTRLQSKRGAISLRFKTTPKPLRAVVRRALSVRPEDRYRNAAEMREAIERASQVGTSHETKPAVRRLPAVLAAVMAVLLLTIAASEAWRWLRQGSDATEREGAVRSEAVAANAAKSPIAAEIEPPPHASTPAVDPIPAEAARDTVASVIPAEPTQPAPAANLPPRLVAREPLERSLRILPGKAVQLSVTVDDPDHDSLRYAWVVAGKAQPETGASLTLQPTRSTQVQVNVSDMRSAAIEPQSWKIEVINAAPTLELTPSENVQLEMGDSREFTAEAWDPDGGAVRTEFLLNGRLVATDRSYRFQAKSAGRYTLAARAIDEHGATTSTQRSVEVLPSAAASPPIAQKQPAAPPSLAPETAARNTIEQYRSAYNAKDLAALARVWNMNPEQKKGTEKMFAEMDRVDLKVDVGEVRRSDDDPNVVFVQIDQSLGGGGGTFLGSNKAQKLTATVTLIGNSWKLTNLSQRAN